MYMNWRVFLDARLLKEMCPMRHCRSQIQGIREMNSGPSDSVSAHRSCQKHSQPLGLRVNHSGVVSGQVQ